MINSILVWRDFCGGSEPEFKGKEVFCSYPGRGDER